MLKARVMQLAGKKDGKGEKAEFEKVEKISFRELK